jgi:hypothetical protein
MSRDKKKSIAYDLAELEYRNFDGWNTIFGFLFEG